MKEEFLKTFEKIDFEKIVDHPNILIAAAFWDDERYAAAKTCYKVMRYIDDLIDNYRTEHPVITAGEQAQLKASVNDWLRMLQQGKSNGLISQELLDTFGRFHIPVWPMEAFARSMIYDISHNGFATLEDFLSYSEGASVAPAAIFVHLCGLRRNNGDYLPPAFEVQEAARACAVFSYLVHIIRDFQKDRNNHLNYFADSLLDKYGLNEHMLDEMAHGTPVNQGFRDMVRDYLLVATEYRQKTLDTIDRIRPFLEPRSQLSLDIIFCLYDMVYERLNPDQSGFTESETTPDFREIKERVFRVIQNFQPE